VTFEEQAVVVEQMRREEAQQREHARRYTR
jgi:hypothetical protein